MSKFSRVFFVLFVLLTVLPVFLLIIWNIMTFQDIERDHVEGKLSRDISRIESKYTQFLLDEKKYLKKLIKSTQNYNLSLEKYKEILNNNQIWWINSNDNNELIFSSEVPFSIPSKYLKEDLAYYDLTYNKETNTEQLSGIFIIQSDTNNHKGIAIVQAVDYRELNPIGPPAILRLYKGKEYNSSNTLYDNFRDKFFEDPNHKPPNTIFGPKRPKRPPKDLKIKGKKYELKDYSGKVIATIQIGVPDIEEPFWFIPNPMLAGVFEKFYIIGALIPLFGLILSIFAGLYIKKFYINPVQDLSDASKKVSEGDITIRVNTEVKQSDIRNTLENFNSMLDSIQEKKELQQNFITNLTHDFRTPLLAENRTLELLLEELKDSSRPEQIDLLKSLLKNNEHLLEMVNLLLENYKFESGNIKLNLQCTNIENLVQQSFTQLRTLAEEKNIELEAEFEPDIPTINVDKSLIKRSFINLIINALENIPKNSKIIVIGKIDKSKLVLTFWDNGPGISKEDAEKLFERYYTGNHTERKIGSGLGLYICHKFIEAHGGNITVNSKKGEYSEFIVTLPLTQEKIV